MTAPEEPVRLATVGDRYVLVELVTADDHREVWRGHDDLASRPVAVTRYLDATAEWRQSFDVRARALEALSDPGIATALRHDAQDEPPWLITGWVEGETVADLVADSGFTVDDALAVVGQTALAIAAAHSAGVGHGHLDADHILVRPDGSVAVIGFAPASAASPAADLRALSTLAGELVDRASADREVGGFLDWLAGRGRAAADDPHEIGRTALALAATHRAGSTSSAAVVPSDRSGSAKAEIPQARRPWYDEGERKRVRNRLIALGAIVVLGGAVLLRIFSAGAGQATVPSVVGLPYVQAQHQLNEVGLRADETLTTGPVGTVGTVIAQDPPAGTRTKVGTLVDLTVATSEAE
ncbi:MAG TPA: PASTA domain-containing protein [Mycobacteriales bacterium]|nr:PASTA domain-containing protein [Mycobacteriales bacterium]